MLRIKVTTKVVLLVIVIVTFEILAIGSSLYLRHKSEGARMSARHSSQVALLANSILALEIQRGSLQFVSAGGGFHHTSLRRKDVEARLRSARIAMDSLLLTCSPKIDPLQR